VHLNDLQLACGATQSQVLNMTGKSLVYHLLLSVNLFIETMKEKVQTISKLQHQIFKLAHSMSDIETDYKRAGFQDNLQPELEYWRQLFARKREDCVRLEVQCKEYQDQLKNCQQSTTVIANDASCHDCGQQV
jgi:NAD-dependent dihydropyrimidine dehydrogenase PreA subunit